ncbi:PfkB family carbohydrate kinase [Alicyclobacillus fastidiosus]|uniref:PfkB family carbohydrate kinase n=1 Tax=Alicyclobacillus fastidiosus TaxID=392011 RepID=A0ABY6ZDZ7_9BACL|nr:PfkB family carbohydrate kinase [Alicyclobacillus fastidiosus]WAH40732.1 PfkB family carbohydrate kinase [Alicyclobacillus fastidiosus]GMA62203.1 hypothetical protein GCM10025859_26430 [Alicyclobacillus fastidiosus]
MIKPNIHEFKQVYPEVTNESTLFKKIMTLIHSGISNAVVTLGEKGCLFVNRESAFYARVPQVDILNPIASGDTFVGGFIANYAEIGNCETAVRFASACGVANAMSLLPEIPKGVDINRLMESILVEIVE